MVLFQTRKKILQRQLRGAQTQAERRRGKAKEREELEGLRTQIKSERGTRNSFVGLNKERFKGVGSTAKKGLGVLAGLAQNVATNINASQQTQKKSKKRKGGFDFKI